VTVAALSSIAPERIPDLLDSGVWARRELGRDDAGIPLVLARWAAPDAVPEIGAENEELTSVWTLLRSAPDDASVIISPGTDAELRITAEEATVLLGGSRGAASALSFRTRARLSLRWALVHRVGDLFAGVLPGPDGREVIPAWFDEGRATALLPQGARLAQLRLLDLLERVDEFDVLIDPGTPQELFIDRLLRRDLLATRQLFPSGYRATLGHLEPRANADFLDAAVAAAAGAKGAGIPLGGLWVVGYRLEDAPAEIIYVVDALDLDGAAHVVVGAVDRVLSGRRPEWVETVLLSSLSEEARDYVTSSTDYVGA
jgi:hypothetical protein